MNARKNMKILAAAALCMAMTMQPVCMLAANTAAHVPNSVEAQPGSEYLPSFKNAKAFRGISVSDKWLRQVRLDGVMLNIRLHTPMGSEVTFREKLRASETFDGGICLYLQASECCDAITMQLDQPAIDALNNLGVVEIAVVDPQRKVRARYAVSELQAVRDALGLADAEQLCVSGEDAPVTVVSEDGVRRQVNP
ncbi:MAG: hypothetical protein IKJ11_06845 [Clostridia bacterium]|nr:hypothetical protein [Clostridia bacterium]